MPGESTNSIGHYLASRSGSSTLTSNLTLPKPTSKPSTFTAATSETKKSKSFEAKEEVKESVPIAKPRSVYREKTPEKASRVSPPRSFPVATKNDVTTHHVEPNSYPIITVGNGGEDWGTKKRVETKTVKTIGKFVLYFKYANNRTIKRKRSEPY